MLPCLFNYTAHTTCIHIHISKSITKGYAFLSKNWFTSYHVLPKISSYVKHYIGGITTMILLYINSHSLHGKIHFQASCWLKIIRTRMKHSGMSVLIQILNWISLPRSEGQCIILPRSGHIITQFSPRDYAVQHDIKKQDTNFKTSNSQ